MKETFSDYIIINIENYTLVQKGSTEKQYVCQLNFLPIVPENALVVDNKKQGILSYAQTSILPGKAKKNKLLGTGVLCKLDDNNKLAVCPNESVNVKFYDRCLNLASVIDSYMPLCKTKNDYKVICLIADKLENLLVKRMTDVFKSQDNKVFLSLSGGVIQRMRNRLGELSNVTEIVKNVMQVDKDYYKEPEFKIIEQEMDY